MLLLVVAFFGLIVGDGIFFYWLLNEFHGWGAVFQDHLALSFIIDAFLTLLILTVHFARTPPGRYRWPWFVILSILGGLCFGVPFYWWINRHAAREPVRTGT